jgi:hypothetical protein
MPIFAILIAKNGIRIKKLTALPKANKINF